MINKRIEIRTGRTDRLCVERDTMDSLLEEPRDILWFRDGMWYCIHKGIVSNTLRLRNEKRQLGLRQAALSFDLSEATPLRCHPDAAPSTSIVKKR